MNKRTRMIQLSALATLVAAVLTTGMPIPGTHGRSNDGPRTPRAQVSLWADGITPPPVPKLPPPKVLGANS